MDSLTQLALGGAVSEAVLGKREGNKAILWGAVVGTIPDLDILLYPFIDDVQQLVVHRGLSHSFAFAALAAPVLGRLLKSVYPGGDTSWLRWSWMCFLVLVTHIGLDSLTNYGTQLFQPLSDNLVAFNTISIVDPLYTLPLLVGIVAALFLRRANPRRTTWNRYGLIVSTAYLGLTVLNKGYVSSVFDEAFARQLGSVEARYNNPTLFNNLLWTGVALRQDTLHVGLYSLFDRDGQIQLQAIPRHSDRIAQYRADEPIRRLLWFSKGFYTVHDAGGALTFNDVRFPRSDLWLGDDGAFLFSYRLVGNTDSTAVETFVTLPLSTRTEDNLLRRFLARVFGSGRPASI
jgi:inner membrane protein